jgi:hypothetical protein
MGDAKDRPSAAHVLVLYLLSELISLSLLIHPAISFHKFFL